MSNIIDSIMMSGTTYAISDSGGTKVVEITQSDYDNLPTSAKTANIMYVITDAEPFDVSNYYQKSQTSGATELATAFAATQPKLSAGTNITIDANNVISAEGGGKAVVGGRGITVTSGTTADTINCTVPASASSGNYSIMFGQPASSGDASGSKTITGGQWSKAYGEGSVAIGQMNESRGSWAWAIGNGTSAVGQAAFACGEHNSTNNQAEFTCGYATITSGGSDTSIMTLFTVGNGTYQGGYQRHNALDIRRNGDIYISNTNDTSTSNYWEKPMIKLQDALGGGGGIDSGTVQTMIDQSISAKTNQSDFVSHSGNTTMHVTASEKTTWNNKSDFSGSYNDLSNKPTIPTSVSQLTNDSGYITSSALNGYATEAYVTAATNDMATKTWVGQQGYLTQHQDISGKLDVSVFESYSGTVDTELSNKLDTSAYTPVVIDSSLNSGSTNAVANSAITAAIDSKQDKGYYFGDVGYDSTNKEALFYSGIYVQGRLSMYNKSDTDTLLGGKQDVSGMTAYTETSAFTAHTADTTIHVTSAEKSAWDSKASQNDLNTVSGDVVSLSGQVSTNTSNISTVSASTASNTTALGGLSLVKLTQTEYDNLSTKDSNTLYVIVN